MLDQFNREINYLRLSVTDRCNLRCSYCMPEEGVKKKRCQDIISYEQIVEVVRAAVELGINKVRLTGGEPLVRLGIETLVEWLKKIDGLKELALTTNGTFLAEKATDLKNAGLDRINVSLDTLNSETYVRLTRGGDIKRVFAGIDRAIQVGFRLMKINMVILPDQNEGEVVQMQAFCREKRMSLQRINHYSLDNYTSLNQNYRAERPLPCELCNRIRVTAEGSVKPCLFSDLEIPLDFSDISKSLQQAINRKPPSGEMCTNRGNWEIGG